MGAAALAPIAASGAGRPFSRLLGARSLQVLAACMVLAAACWALPQLHSPSHQSGHACSARVVMVAAGLAMGSLSLASSSVWLVLTARGSRRGAEASPLHTIALANDLVLSIMWAVCLVLLAMVELKALPLRREATIAASLCMTLLYMLSAALSAHVRRHAAEHCAAHGARDADDRGDAKAGSQHVVMVSAS